MIRIGLAGVLFVAGVALAGTPTGALAATGGGGHTVSPCAQYKYQGTETNLCETFPGTSDRDCSEVNRAAHGRTVVVTGKDVWRLDKDGDDIACEVETTTPPTTPPTTAPTTTPTTQPTTAPTTVTPTETATTRPTTKPTTAQPTTTAPVGNAGGGNDAGPTLPKTGPTVGLLAGLGAVVVAAGAVLFVMTRRRKQSFEA